MRLCPDGKFQLIEAACDLWIGPDDLQRLMGACREDRNTQLVREVLDGVQSGALVTGAAGEQVLYLIKQKHSGRGMPEHIHCRAIQQAQTYGR